MIIAKDNNQKQYRYIAIFLTAAFILLTVTVYKNALIRTVEAVRDLGLSIAYYLLSYIDMSELITPTVGTLSSLDFSVVILITWEGFKENFVAFFQAFFKFENFVGFFDYSYTAIYTIVFVFLIVVLAFVMVKNVLRNYLSNQNNDTGKISKPLNLWLKAEASIFRPFGSRLEEFKEYVSDRKIFVYIWVFTWAVNLNAITIVAEALAYILYVLASFDFLGAYLQVYKLAIDLMLTFRALPLIVWAYVVLKIIGRWRENVGYDRLTRFELRNRGFIKSLPIAVLIVGPMGSRKTTLLTDLAISQEIIDREDALNMLYENAMKFPHFPWQKFEDEIFRKHKSGEIANIAFCDEFVSKLEEVFREKPFPRNLFGYKFEKYGLSFYDNLKTISIFDVLRSYSKLYFVYTFETSLIVSNYSIREDNVLTTAGNFPLWSLDIFHRSEAHQQDYSQFSHILNFDAIRPGKKKKERGKVFGSLEFGVGVITEFGKERGNKESNEGKTKGEEEANQKNDLTNLWIKMCRHIGATIDNHCFFRLFTDEQRVMSLGADARELCSVINIDDGGEFENVMPCFLFGEMLNDLVFSKFESLYEEYRYNRADETLFMYLLRSVVSKFLKHYKRIHNTFDVAEMTLSKEAGTLDGKREKHSYYLSKKKTYSERFSTDCFSDFFAVQALKTGKSLEDYPAYQSVKATVSELEKQNSYFIDDISRLRKKTPSKASQASTSRKSHRR